MATSLPLSAELAAVLRALRVATAGRAAGVSGPNAGDDARLVAQLLKVAGEQAGRRS